MKLTNGLEKSWLLSPIVFIIQCFLVSALGLSVGEEIKVISVLAYFETCTHDYIM